jgi:hypothetical protein
MRSPAWLLTGLTRSVAGELRLTTGRIVFVTRDGQQILDAALAEVSAVTFPWYYFGGGMKLRIGTDTHRLSFTRPGNLPEFSSSAEHGDIISGRRAGAAWKAALAAAISHR